MKYYINNRGTGKMNRKEAIEKLKNIRNVPSMFIDKTIEELVEVLESSLTLADLLGWEENVEYELKNRKFIILADNKLYELFNGNWYSCSFSINTCRELQQATKVEPKLKAYHVKDEYSYDCLMEELEKQGHNVKYADFHRSGDDIIYIEEDGEIMHSSLSYYEQYEKDNYDLIEYHKEEPRYYAKIKGWELVANSSHIYWNRNDYGNSVFVNDISEPKGFTITLTKAEWNKLGINDTNADFEKVED